MNGENNKFYEFGSFRLDVEQRSLTRTDGLEASHLPDKAFNTLCLLVEQSGRLLSKSEIIDHVWPDSFVEENNLDKSIHAIRHALGEKANEHRYIETVRKHGYRFVAEVRTVSPANGGHALQESSEVTAEQIGLPARPVVERSVRARPQTGQHSKVTIGLAIFFALVIGTGAYFAPLRFAAANTPMSLAVMPLKPVNSGDRNLLHEGGIADSLILRLNAIKGFTVRPLSAVRKYFDVDPDPIVVGREQLVDYVLAANYQLSNGRIQVTAQLFNVETSQVAATFKVERDASDTFAMQDAVAREISEGLAARFGLYGDSIVSKRGTANEEAYRYYIHALNLMGRTSLPIAQESVEYLEQATVLDPKFARAYAALARGRVELANLVDDPGPECGKAKLAVEQALALDPELSDIHQASGVLKHRCEWDFAGAEPELKRAIQLDSNSDSAHAAYAAYLNTVGRSDAALAEIERAIELNPNSMVYHVQHGITLYFARQYDASIDAFRHAGEVGQLGMAHGWLWTVFIKKGDDAQAFDWYLKYETEKQLKPDPAKIEHLRSIYKAKGWKGIREMQFEAEKASPVYVKGRFYRMSRLASQLGNADEAFAYLNKAFERRDAQLLLLKYEPTFDALHADPRFNELIERIGFPRDK